MATQTTIHDNANIGRNIRDMLVDIIDRLDRIENDDAPLAPSVAPKPQCNGRKRTYPTPLTQEQKDAIECCLPDANWSTPISVEQLVENANTLDPTIKLTRNGPLTRSIYAHCAERAGLKIKWAKR